MINQIITETKGIDMKRILLSALIAMMLISLLSLCVLSAAAEEPQTGSCGENVYWTFDPATGELVVSGQGPMSDYTIMNMPQWRAYSSSITSVTVEEGVTAVGVYSFFYCGNLTEVSLPNSLTAIGANAFSGCSKLERIRIPEGLTQIGVGTFQNCSSLTEISLPMGVTEIPSSSFTGCSALTSVSLPGQVTVIGELAFLNCSSLTEVSLPTGLTSIGNKAFSGCSMLEAVSLPATLTALGDNVFADTHLSKVLFEGTRDEWDTVSVGAGNELLTDKLLIHPGHLFDLEIADPAYLHAEASCVSPALYYRSCACGEAGDETFSHGELADHTAGAAPTCTEDQLCVVCQTVLAERLGHDHIPEITTAPTCTEAGVRTHTCSRCEDRFEEAVDPTGHTEGAPATCETPQLCSDCGIILANPLGHDFHANTVEPTCVAQGYTAHVCSRCDHTYHDSFTSAKGHTPGEEATCTSPQFCLVCNGLLAEALGHEYTHSVTEATCTAAGYTTHTCTRCAYAYRDSYTDVKEHTPGAEASCTKPQICETCGKILTDAPGHNYIAVIVPPTCTARGYTSHTCSRCEDSYTDTPVDATGHTAGAAATCTSDQTCTVCGTVLAQRLGHDYLAAVTLQPTCTEQGVMTHTCSRCNDTYTRPIAPNGHTPGAESTCTAAQLCTVCGIRLTDKLGHNFGATAVEPTCTEKGYTLHTCSRCDEAYLDAFVPAKGHTPGEAASCTRVQTCTVCAAFLADKLEHDYTKTTVGATCLEQGYTLYSCSRCDHEYVTAIKDPLGHKAGPKATCTSAQTCTRCNAILADKLGHTLTETTVDPTCTGTGYVHHYCSVCKITFCDNVVPPLGHAESDWILDRNPGYGEAGRKHTTCTVCGTLLESETFWEKDTDPDPTPETDTTGATVTPESGTDAPQNNNETGGCGQAFGNTLVIAMILVAAFLFWFIDSKRRHS